MEQTLPIIETKLIPPMIKKSVIRRRSLMKKLRTYKSYPLTFIHSGAGYGKSTNLILFLDDFNIPYCWYTITVNDDDLIPFITYVVFSVKKRFPHFGNEILEYINTIDRYVQESEINMLHALLIKELTLLNEEITIVLDDFHLIDHSFTINQWLEKVIEHLPNNVSIIIASRTKPKWNLLTRWKVSGRLLEIDESEMMLNLDELEILFEDYYGLVLSKQQLVSIYELTEGWVIAISLIAEQIKSGASVESVLTYHHSSMDDLFQYLAMEVFTKQSPIVQSFIEQVSTLEEITPELCNEILGIKGSEAILEQLVEQNAFMSKLTGTSQYRFHALFKAAVEKNFREQQFTLYCQINERIARFYEHQSSWELAIIHFEKANNYYAVAQILEKAAPNMIKGRKIEQLHDQFKKLPSKYKNQYLSLWYYEGEVHRLLSFYEKAKNCYLHLIVVAESAGNLELVGKAYEGLAKIYLDTIQPGIAERYLHQAIETMEKSVGKDHADTQTLYGMMAENLINSGQAKKAEKWLKKMNVLKETMALNNLDARMYLRTGKLEKARKLLLERLKTEDNSLPQTHRETEILLSFIEACLGNGAEAKQFAQKGIEQGVKYKNPFVEACGWMRLGHAGQIVNDYTPNLAEQCYLTALDIMEKIHVSRGKAEPYMGLCILYSRRNEYERSFELGQNALFETEKVHDIWLSSYIRLSLGIASINCEKWEDAYQYFKEVRQNFVKLGDPFGFMLSQLWLSYYYFHKEAWKEFAEAITTCLQEIQIGNYDFIFYKQTLYSPKDLQSFIPILMKAKDLDIFKSYVHLILQNLGYDDLESHPGYSLKVNTFGSFQVYLGDKLVTDKDWQRMKAKELFQFLILKKDHWWTKEEIYEQLWPDVNEKNIEQEFKVILNACNKALEPNRKARTQPFYIERQNNTYRINPRAVIELDFEQFEHWVQQGLREKEPEKAIALLLKGLDLYKGDFLGGKLDFLSIESERNHYQTLFLRGAERLAQLYVQLRKLDEAIFWCEKLISIDSTWEEAYRLMMYCHYQKNNRPLALKYYQQCIKVLKEEFDVEPMEATKQMYEMIREEMEIE